MQLSFCHATVGLIMYQNFNIFFSPFPFFFNTVNKLQGIKNPKHLQNKSDEAANLRTELTLTLFQPRHVKSSRILDQTDPEAKKLKDPESAINYDGRKNFGMGEGGRDSLTTHLIIKESKIQGFKHTEKRGLIMTFLKLETGHDMSPGEEDDRIGSRAG